MIRKRLAILMVIGIMAVSVFCGTAETVFAANTKDKEFSFDNRNSNGVGTWREKHNNTKVYVYPKSGPKIFYTVQGKTGDAGTAADRSNIVAIPQGIQGSITNQVNEKKNDYARLKYERITFGYVLTKGVWSPDSTKNYTIYN